MGMLYTGTPIQFSPPVASDDLDPAQTPVASPGTKIAGLLAVLAGMWMLGKSADVSAGTFFPKLGAALLLGIGGITLLRK